MLNAPTLFGITITQIAGTPVLWHPIKHVGFSAISRNDFQMLTEHVKFIGTHRLAARMLQLTAKACILSHNACSFDIRRPS